MKVLMRMPSRVQRATSVRVASTVSGTGGYWKKASPWLMMWAVGSPSVILMICLVPLWRRSMRRLLAGAGGMVLVTAERVLGQLGEQIRQGVLADPAHAPRRQLVAALPLLDEPGLLQQLGQLGQAVQGTGGVVAHQVAGPLDVD